MKVILQSGDPSEFDKWRKFADGKHNFLVAPCAFISMSWVLGSGSTALMHELLDNYGSVLDHPAVMWPDELYAAYPDAKFILVSPFHVPL